MSDVWLLRVGIVVAGLLLIAAIYFFGRPRRGGQGRRLSAEERSDRMEPTLGSQLERELAAGGDYSSEHVTQAEIELIDGEGVAGIANSELGKRNSEDFDKIITLYIAARAGEKLRGPDIVVAAEKAGHGEAGLVRHLAARAGIDTASMDIPLEEEAQLLRRELPQGEALVYLVVRQLASYNRKTARMDFDGYFADFFARIAPSLELSIDWPLIEKEHLRVLGRPLSARRVTAIETDPMRDELPTQRTSRLSNRLRDEHMLGRLIAALDEHPRVFATVGVSHAVMLEPALRAAIER